MTEQSMNLGGVVISKPATAKEYYKSRNLIIYEQRKAGMTLAEIGDEHQISMSRVADLCKRRERADRRELVRVESNKNHPKNIQSFETMDITVRLANVMHWLGVSNVEQYVGLNLSKEVALKIPNFGRKTYFELIDVIHNAGFKYTPVNTHHIYWRIAK